MVREQVAKMTQRRNDNLASALRWALSDCSRPSAAEPRYSAHAGGKGRAECQRHGDIMEVLPRVEAAAAGGVARGWPPTKKIKNKKTDRTSQHAAKQTLNRVDGSARAEQTMRLRRMCRLFCIPDGDVCSRGVWLHGQGGGTVSYPGRLGDRAAEGRRVDVLIGFECIWRVLPVCRCYGSDASEFGWRWLASCWGCW